MSKPVTVIISDLHLGGGPTDPGDDHVYQGDPLVRLFRDELGKSNRGKRGEIEVLINGDLFELAQVQPDIYAGRDYVTWSSEAESLQKMNVILKGHAGIFAAMKVFQGLGNIVTMAAGNHDVDLYWPEVQKRIRDVAGPVQFELGNTWYSRHDGRLQTSHGHMEDPANKFKNWQDPIHRPEHEAARLEMCPGTVFMLKIVNVLEKDYPFVDNIKPITALARLLWRENKRGFSGVAWLLVKFMAKHPSPALGVNISDPGEFHKKLKRLVEINANMRQQVREIAEVAYGKPQTDEDVAKLLASEQALLDFMMDVLRVRGLDGLKKLELSAGGALAVGGATGTLAIQQAGRMDEKEHLRIVAEGRFRADGKCEVVVMGHTHQPHDLAFGEKRYYNPGSWTRYADISTQDALTLEKLKDESKFPYYLNYVWVEEAGGGPLKSEMKTFEANPGEPF